ncbi:MAG: hypothetical protein WC081_07905 [Candidatus Ratteibacteria bacterium]
MKKTWVIAAAVIVVIAAVIYSIKSGSHQSGNKVSEPISFSLSTTETSAAVNYGKNQRGDLLVDFEKPWTVFLGYGPGKGSATIFTPYHCLALIARNSAKDNSDVDTESLRRICAESYKDLYFEVTLYDNKENFDRDYKAVLLKDGREIPVLKVLQQGYDEAREYTLSSQQKLYFPIDILRGKSEITLRIVRPEAPPLDFVFDLNKIP